MLYNSNAICSKVEQYLRTVIITDITVEGPMTLISNAAEYGGAVVCQSPS